jgi:hypothetical protein
VIIFISHRSIDNNIVKIREIFKECYSDFWVNLEPIQDVDNIVRKITRRCGS